MPFIKTIRHRTLSNCEQGQACSECQTSCQSACKTSCTVANQPCERDDEVID